MAFSDPIPEYKSKINKKLDENLNIRNERILNEFGESLTTPLVFTKSGIFSTRNALEQKNSTTNIKYITIGSQSPYYEANKDEIILNISFLTNSSGKFVISSSPSNLPSWTKEQDVLFDLYFSTTQISSRYQAGLTLISSSIKIDSLSAEFDYSSYTGSFYFSLFARDKIGNYLDDLNYFANTTISDFTRVSDVFTFGGGTGIYKAVKDDDGSVFIAGDFTTINGQSVPRLAKIKPDLSSLDPAFSGNVSNGLVNAICISGSHIYIGGSFTTVSSSSRTGFAKLNKSTGQLDTSFVSNLGSSTQINAIVVNENIIYVGGTFTTISGTTRNRIASVNPSNGNVFSWDPNSSSTVNDIHISGSVVYIGGSFTSLSGSTRNSLGAVNLTSSNLTSWNPNVTITGSGGGSVSSIYPYSTMFYICGNFNSVGGVNRFNFASIEKSTGNLVTTNIISASRECKDVLIYDNNIFIGGLYTAISSSFGNYSSNKFIKFKTSNYTGSTYNINSTTGNGVYKMLQIDNQNILIVGNIINYLKKLSYSSSINNFK
jgi:hypothetical protein